MNWIKGEASGPKLLFMQEGNKAGVGEHKTVVDYIGPSLSLGEDVTQAKSLKANRKAACFQGQTHGHEGFLVKRADAKAMLAHDSSGTLSKVLRPFLIANDLVGRKQSEPQRYVIDFRGLSVLEAEEYPLLFARVKNKVLPTRKAAAEKESTRNKQALASNPKAKVNVHHANFLKKSVATFIWSRGHDRGA